MTDFVAFIVMIFAALLVRVFGIILLPWSIYLAIKQRRLNSYLYEVGRGLDILANKLYEPALNSKLQNDGHKFGQDETISQSMARNKFETKTDTDTARWWEKRINFFDKQHLAKTYSKLKK